MQMYRRSGLGWAMNKWKIKVWVHFVLRVSLLGGREGVHWAEARLRSLDYSELWARLRTPWVQGNKLRPEKYRLHPASLCFICFHLKLLPLTQGFHSLKRRGIALTVKVLTQEPGTLDFTLWACLLPSPHSPQTDGNVWSAVLTPLRVRDPFKPQIESTDALYTQNP